jgi:uncharacterized RDD family membrane protein YckC
MTQAPDQQGGFMDQSGSTSDPGAPSGSGWTAPPPPPVQPGPTGFVYADVPNRAIAYIIDAIIVAVLAGIVGIFLGAVGLSTGSFTPGTLNWNLNVAGLVVSAIVFAVISAAYFTYTWTTMRGTYGMKALGLQIGNAGDGKTLTMDQATRRWLIIAAPGVVAQVFFAVPAVGPLLGLLAFGWFLYLLWTTYSSPTKQGFHDIFANTMVVKATRVAG